MGEKGKLSELEELELQEFLDWYLWEPNFLNWREWCFPVEFANGIFA